MLSDPLLIRETVGQPTTESELSSLRQQKRPTACFSKTKPCSLQSFPLDNLLCSNIQLHTHTYTQYLSISNTTHTQSSHRFHSTESAVQRVLSGQQRGRWRAGWRSGKSWALNFRKKLVSYQDCCTFSLAVFSSVLSPLIHKPPEALRPPFFLQFSLSPSAPSCSAHFIEFFWCCMSSG